MTLPVVQVTESILTDERDKALLTFKGGYALLSFEDHTDLHCWCLVDVKQIMDSKKLKGQISQSLDI